MTKALLLPKADFLADAPRAGRHQDLMATPEIREALKIALLHYAMKLGGESADAQQLVTVGLRLEGAKGFISELLNLGQPVKQTDHPSDDQLEPV